jgi:hypothetical protein
MDRTGRKDFASDRVGRAAAELTALAGRARELLASARRRHDDPRAAFVRKVLPKHGVGAELGVFRGHFSPVLFAEASPTCLHLVDPWYLLTPRWHWGTGDRSTVNALRRILKRWKREIEAGRVVVHVGDDRDVLRSFADGQLDWAYIDSSHAYEHTRDELRLLHDKVSPGGVIAGDDWQPDPSHQHHGVHRAVQEFAAESGYEIIYAEAVDRQWAIRRAVPSRVDDRTRT